MIKLASDIAKDIRTELKELGFNSKKVRQQCCCCNAER